RESRARPAAVIAGTPGGRAEDEGGAVGRVRGDQGVARSGGDDGGCAGPGAAEPARLGTTEGAGGRTSREADAGHPRRRGDGGGSAAGRPGGGRCGAAQATGIRDGGAARGGPDGGAAECGGGGGR